jgi:hypothetical protein
MLKADFRALAGVGEGEDSFKLVMRELGSDEDDDALTDRFMGVQHVADELFDALDSGGGDDEVGGQAHDGMVSFKEYAQWVRLADGIVQYAKLFADPDVDLDINTIAQLDAAADKDYGVIDELPLDENLQAHEALKIDGVISHRERNLLNYVIARTAEVPEGIKRLLEPVKALQFATRQNSGEPMTVDH